MLLFVCVPENSKNKSRKKIRLVVNKMMVWGRANPCSFALVRPQSQSEGGRGGAVRRLEVG